MDNGTLKFKLVLNGPTPDKEYSLDVMRGVFGCLMQSDIDLILGEKVPASEAYARIFASKDMCAVACALANERCKWEGE